jgi:carbonic anhydrase/acetyltransferase-like protein (isoleucine patch superfamily)
MTIHHRGWRRGLMAAAALLGLTAGSLVVSGFVSSAEAATKTLYIPSSWTSTGEVPWSADRTKESANFILLWGEKSGTDPTTAATDYRFDPASILSQLETLYSFYVNTMQFTPETGYLAQYKIDVIVTNTWNRTELNAWATGGSVDGKVGVINIAPGAAQPGSWGLAHELAHVFQCYTFMGRSGYGLTDASAGTFWESSAEFMAMQVYPDTAAGDLTRFLRTENLYYSSSRHHYGAWMLIQYIVDHHGGITMFNRIWNEAKTGEHPLEVYRRINGLTQDQLDQQLGEYAQHQVTYDYSNRGHVLPFITNVYGAGFINAYNGVAVDAVNTATGHYAVSNALAPSDFGYNKIKLVPSSDGALIRLHFKGHVNSAAGSGWSYGFVAVKNGTPRYGPVSTSADGELSFQTQSGESEVYLTVLGAPNTVHHYGFLDGYPKNYRYPYEFRIDGAVPSGYEPGYTKPAATGGGHWHSNGGGWVSDSATVASTAYVGPRAAVYGTSTVSGNARIEGMAWVNSGATVGGNAVVKDNALVQGGANLSGSIVVGGDAEVWAACGSGTYLMFSDTRGCDGGGGETDVNPAYSAFTDTELAITGTTTPSASASASAAPSQSQSATASPVASSASATTSGTGSAGVACTAVYKIANQWSGGFQGEVTVTAATRAITGWRVVWQLPTGQAVTQAWNATVVSASGGVTAQPVSWNSSLAAGASTTFGFIGTSTATPTIPATSCTAN